MKVASIVEDIQPMMMLNYSLYGRNSIHLVSTLQTVNVAQTYHITSMDVLIEGLLDQVLWLEASEGGHPLVEEDQLQIQRCSGGQFFLRTSSRQNRQNHHIDEKFKTNLNIKTLLCILISVMEEGGNE